jgi:hypothetical protein
MPLVLTLSNVSPDTWSREITLQPQIVGRADSAEVRLESVLISKHHCRIWQEDDVAYVEDCGSTNGTYLNGQRVERHEIDSGDAIVIGNFELVIAESQDVRPTDYEMPAIEMVFDKEMLAVYDEIMDEEADVHSPNRSRIDERRLAAAVHQRLTPTRRMGLPGMLVEVAYLPSGLMGGDCFECFELDGRWVFGIFDPMNHGTKAALAIMLLRSELSRWVALTSEPGKCLQYINDVLTALEIDELFLSAALAIWYPATSNLVYSTAGMQQPLLLRSGHIDTLNGMACGLPLGVRDKEKFNERILTLQQGDRVFFFTDGLADAVRGKRIDAPAASCVAEELMNRRRATLQDQVRGLLDVGKERVLDDALLVGCHIGHTRPLTVAEVTTDHKT